MHYYNKLSCNIFPSFLNVLLLHNVSLRFVETCTLLVFICSLLCMILDAADHSPCMYVTIRCHMSTPPLSLIAAFHGLPWTSRAARDAMRAGCCLRGRISFWVYVMLLGEDSLILLPICASIPPSLPPPTPSHTMTTVLHPARFVSLFVYIVPVYIAWAYWFLD